MHTRAYIRLWIGSLFLTALSLLLISCGRASTSSSGTTAPSATSGIAATGTAGAVGTSAATGTVSTISTPTTSQTVIPNQVRLALNQARYSTHDVITVTILNGLSSSIYATQYHTNCTLVVLEQQSGTNWIPAERCLAERAQIVHSVELKPGSATQQQLTAGSGVQKPVTNAAWQPGTYRVILAYSMNANNEESSTSVIIAQSEPFTIA